MNKVKGERGQWFFLTLAVLFFLSGVCGLVYQVLWLRQLSLIFGVTIYAASTVLAAFMAGLAIGSYFAGRLIDRARNPLMWYGVVEVMIGVSALLTAVALNAIGPLYAGFYNLSLNSIVGLTAFRLLLSFAVLIVPTTLMGATLPIIIKSSLLSVEGLGGRVSFLYATNTAGAIAGTLLAGFYLIGGVGMAQSFKLAAALNVLIGIIAIGQTLVLGRRVVAVKDVTPASSEVAADAEAKQRIPHRTRRVVLMVFALSGLISLALEVVWFRILVLFLEVTTYAFTIMLATFLSGIAVGSYVVTPFMARRLNWLKILAVIEIAIAVTIGLSLVALGYAYGADLSQARSLRKPSSG